MLVRFSQTAREGSSRSADGRLHSGGSGGADSRLRHCGGSCRADLFSESQRIKHTIVTKTQGIQDVRTYLMVMMEIRIKMGLVDELGAEAMMMDALDKVEKELKKPLMRNDKKGMELLKAEFDKVNQKLGIRKEDLPKLEEQVELKIAKAQLEELKKDAVEAMETQKKREEFKDEEMPEVKSLDIRNFI